MSILERRTAAIQAWNRFWVDGDLEALRKALASIHRGERRA
jgi:hypothetical protein